MSWFSVIQHGKSLWDQHAFAKSIFTGNIATNFIFQKGIKNTFLHKIIREAVSDVFAKIAAPRLFRFSPRIAFTVLNKSLKRDKFLYLGGRLLTTKNIFSAGKTSFFVLKNYTGSYLSNPFASVSNPTPPPANILTSNTTDPQHQSDDAQVITKSLKNFEISQAAQRLMISSLRPICERAVRSSMVSLTKAVGRGVYDFSIMKIVSLTAMPIIYQGVLSALEWSGQHDDNSFIGSALSVKEYVSPHTLLRALAIINALDMIYIFGSALRASTKQSQKEDVDKEEVKKLAIKHAQAPITKKLQENAFLKLAGISNDQEKIDSITNTLIDEAIELYWKDLKTHRILGLPLVS